jgi:dTDP-4-dehydrorhamnose reductase
MAARALILGAGGMLGSECALSAPPGVEAVAAVKFEGDVTNLDSLRSLFARAKPNLVINAAAYTAVDAAETARDKAFAVNDAGARNVAIACREAGARLVHVSTDFVFDGNATKPYAEWDLPNPRGAYAESKYCGELAVMSIGGDWQIVRTQWVYGARGKHFVAAILKAARERDRLSVVDDQRGCPTCTHDLARELWRIALQGGGGLYHASSNGECTWREFATEIVRLAGLATPVDPITTADWNRTKPGSAPRPAYSVLAKEHLSRSLGNRFPDWRAAIAAFFARGDAAN